MSGQAFLHERDKGSESRPEGAKVKMAVLRLCVCVTVCLFVETSVYSPNVVGGGSQPQQTNQPASEQWERQESDISARLPSSSCTSLEEKKKTSYLRVQTVQTEERSHAA